MTELTEEQQETVSQFVGITGADQNIVCLSSLLVRCPGTDSSPCRPLVSFLRLNGIWSLVLPHISMK